MKKPDPVQSIMDSLRRIVRALRTSTRSSESETGLRTAQVFVLQQMKKFEPLSLNDLAERTYSHQSTVSLVVQTLVKAGYVRRSRHKKDRRILVLETTPKGKLILQKHQPAIQKRFSGVLEAMAPKDRKEFARLLELFVTEAGLGGQVPHFFFEKERKTLRSKV
jgi:DNA-binding MarR family transcriptional regulator